MKICIVGIGMDGGDTLTVGGKKAVESADLLIGAKRMIEPFMPLGKPYIISYNTAEICQILDETSFESVAVLMSGDCGFFSGAKALADSLSGKDVEIINGISSPVYFCGKIAENWEEMKFISLHGAEGNIAVNVRCSRKCFFLLGGKITASDVCQTLCRYGLSGVYVYIGENLGYPGERIISGTAGQLINQKTENLVCMIVINENYQESVASGIEDSEFIRRKIPMTKSEIRGISVSKLKIGKNDICWDIGCGTGSVSVEMALRCPGGKVYSFDKKEEAAELTLENARKFSCDNIKTYFSELPKIPEKAEIEPPDKVFVGGSSGNFEDILKLVLELNPNAVFVANAVTVETIRAVTEAFERNGLETEITQIAVTRTEKIGNSTMFSALNPVFIIKGEKN